MKKITHHTMATLAPRLQEDADWPALAQAVQMLMQQPGVQEPLQ